MTDRVRDRQVSAMMVTGKATVDPVLLEKRLDIPLRTAQQTIKKTTQCGIKTVLNPVPSRCLFTNDRQLQYRQLPINVFIDTMEASVKSKRGN